MLPLFMPTMNGVVVVVFMANCNWQPGYRKADILYFMFGVKAIPVQPSPADTRLISWVPSYGFCVAGTSCSPR